MKRAEIVAKTKCIMYNPCGMKDIARNTPEACPLQMPGIPCVEGYHLIYGKGVRSNAKEETFGRTALRNERKARSARARSKDQGIEDEEEITKVSRYVPRGTRKSS